MAVENQRPETDPEETFMKILSTRLKHAREQVLKVSQEEMAERMEVSLSTYKRWESNQTKELGVDSYFQVFDQLEMVIIAKTGSVLIHEGYSIWDSVRRHTRKFLSRLVERDGKE